MRYGFLGSIYLLICLFKTKFVFKNARLIRFPIDIRGKKNIEVGKRFTTGKYCRLEVLVLDKTNKPDLTIGDNVQMNDSVHIAVVNKVTIGNDVLIASKVFITDHNHGNYAEGSPQDAPTTIPYNRKIISNPVVIGDRVWLGEHVCVLPGVIIGEGSIVGSLSVVTKNIPPNCIAAGNPAKIIKRFNFKNNTWEKVPIEK